MWRHRLPLRTRLWNYTGRVSYLRPRSNLFSNQQTLRIIRVLGVESQDIGLKITYCYVKLASNIWVKFFVDFYFPKNLIWHRLDTCIQLLLLLFRCWNMNVNISWTWICKCFVKSSVRSTFLTMPERF